jgi:hypothetical protein
VPTYLSLRGALQELQKTLLFNGRQILHTEKHTGTNTKIESHLKIMLEQMTRK